MVFAIVTDPNSLGVGGGGFGWYGVTPGLAVEFDTFENFENSDPDGNHVGIDLNGGLVSVAANAVASRMNDGGLFCSWVEYNGVTKVLEARLAQSTSRPANPLLAYFVDLPALLRTTDAVMGFGAGTGFATNQHEIVSWQVTTTPAMGETPTGSNVTVPVSTTFFHAKTGLDTEVEVDVTFATVTSEGFTSVEATSTPAEVPPTTYTADIGLCSRTRKLGCQTDEDCPTGETCKGYHGFAFDVSTTASVSGPVTVCSHYEDNERRPAGGNGYVDGTGKPGKGIPEKSLRMLAEEGGVFTDITLPGYPDTLANVVCGQVNSLVAAAGRVAARGKLGLYLRTDMPGGPIPPTAESKLTDCFAEWSRCTPKGCGGQTVPKLTADNPVPPAVLTGVAKKAKCKNDDTVNDCTFCVRICAKGQDKDLFPDCAKTDLRQYLLTKPLPTSTETADVQNAQNILSALQALPNSQLNPINSTVSFDPALTPGETVCSGDIILTVPLKNNNTTQGKKTVTLTGVSSSGETDVNKLDLICNPKP
jgi:hypothetical protein